MKLSPKNGRSSKERTTVSSRKLDTKLCSSVVLCERRILRSNTSSSPNYSSVLSHQSPASNTRSRSSDSSFLPSDSEEHHWPRLSPSSKKVLPRGQQKPVIRKMKKVGKNIKEISDRKPVVHDVHVNKKKNCSCRN